MSDRYILAVSPRQTPLGSLTDECDVSVNYIDKKLLVVIDPNSMLIDIETVMKIGISKDVVGR